MNKRGNALFDLMAVLLILILVASLVLNRSSFGDIQQMQITESENDFNYTMRSIAKSLTVSPQIGRTKVSVTNYLPIRGVGEDKGKFFYYEALNPETGSLNDFSDVSASVVNKIVLAGIDVDVLSDPANSSMSTNLQSRAYVNKSFQSILIPSFTAIAYKGIPYPKGIFQLTPDLTEFRKKPLETSKYFLLPKDLHTYISSIDNTKY